MDKVDNKKKIKVLLAAVHAGQGHITLRNSMLTELEKHDDIEAVSFDHPDRTLDKTNDLIPKYSPTLNDFLYFFSPRAASSFFLAPTFRFFRKTYQILKETDPDIVLATHFLLSMHFSIAKRLLNSKAVIVNCIPDYGPPSKIMNPRLNLTKSDKIMVFEEWTYKESLKLLGVKEENLYLSGFIPKKIFRGLPEKYGSKKQARVMLKKTFNYFPYTDIDPEKTTVLVSAGSSYAKLTLPLLKDIAREQKEDLSLVNKFQFFIIAGKDTKFFEDLTKKNKKYRYWSNIFPFPWVDQQVFAQIQYACDLPILGSIAPATMNELLEAECGPFLVYKTRPGQELAHRAFVEEKQIGTYIPDSKKLMAKLNLGITEASKSTFLKAAKRFRSEQTENAKKLSGIIREIYKEVQADSASQEKSPE